MYVRSDPQLRYQKVHGNLLTINRREGGAIRAGFCTGNIRPGRVCTCAAIDALKVPIPSDVLVPIPKPTTGSISKLRREI
jgi:hypothetical protein